MVFGTNSPSQQQRVFQCLFPLLAGLVYSRRQDTVHFLLMCQKNAHMGEVVVCGSLRVSRLQTVGHAKVVLHVGLH